MKYTYSNGCAFFENVSDFDIAQTFDCGQCFRFDLVDGYWQGISCGRFARFNQPSPDTLEIYADQADIDYWVTFLALDTDYSAVKEDIASKFGGQTILSAMECGSGIRILRQHPWETLISFIISQNNNIPRIKKIVESLCREFGEKIECGERVYYAFPTPEALYNAGESAIFALKTGFRARYIYDAASRVVDGRLNIDALCEMDSDTLNEALLEICGVGPKVAACVSLFGFGHTEAFPIDVWVKRIMLKYYPDGLDIKSLGRYAGVAQQYLFYYERYLGGDKN